MSECTNAVCPYCLEIVHGWPEAPGCCGEAHAYECGAEGKLCPECLQKEMGYWAEKFGILPDMTKEERKAQIERFRPAPPAGDPLWNEWKKL